MSKQSKIVLASAVLFSFSANDTGAGFKLLSYLSLLFVVWENLTDARESLNVIFSEITILQ